MAIRCQSITSTSAELLPTRPLATIPANAKHFHSTNCISKISSECLGTLCSGVIFITRAETAGLCLLCELMQRIPKFSLWSKNTPWRRLHMETFSALLAFLMDSPHEGHWRGALVFYLICAWTNGSAYIRDPGDLRRHSAHYRVTVMHHLPLAREEE